MPEDHEDRNLLFGVLALQADLLDVARFAEACKVWSAHKDTPLADLLVDRGWISAQDRAEIERLLKRKLKKHDGDVHGTLAEAAGLGVQQALAQVADPKVRQSLDGFGSTVAPTDVSSLSPLVLLSSNYQSEGRGRYTRTRLHAKGGIGQVWLAHDASLGRDVALKELRPERSDNAAVAEQFLTEARITGQLEHPGIVPVYELSEPASGSQPFYTMRFIQGRTFTEAIRIYHKDRELERVSPLALRELLGAFVGVCNAIAYAHSRGVIHRDLKGQNVVLGEFGEVMVLDWGLAKVLDRPEGEEEEELPSLDLARGTDVSATLQGQVLGTPAYMAPEQAAGRIDLIGPHTDVYGLGAILYELLCGETPFTGKTTEEVLRQVCEKEPVPPRKICPSVPLALQAICRQAMAKQPSGRYASAADLAQDVKRWLADERVSAYREPISARMGRWVRRRKALVSGAVAVLFVTAVALAAGTILLGRANGEIREKRLEAESNLREAQIALESYFLNVTQNKLLESSQPGLQSLRKELLEEGLRYYEDLTQRSSSTPLARENLARAYFQLGRVMVELGAPADALAPLEKAHVLYAALGKGVPGPAHPEMGQRLAPVPGNPGQARENLARVENNLGLAYLELGKPKEASEAFQHGVELMEQRRTSLPPNAPELPGSSSFATVLHELAWESNNLAIAQRRVGRVAEAEQSSLKAIALWKALTKTAPKNAAYRNGLATTTSNLGILFQEIGQPARVVQLMQESVGHHRQALALHEGQAERSNDERVRLRAALASTLDYLGEFHLESGQTAKARAAFDEALAIMKELAQGNLNVLIVRERLARTYEHLGRADVVAGEDDAALRSFQKCLELTARTPGDRSRSGLPGVAAACRRGIGQVYLKQGKNAEALKSLRMAIAEGEPIAASQPRSRFDLACAEALCSTAEAPAEQGRHAEKAMQALREAAAQGYRNVSWMRRDPCLNSLRKRPDFQQWLQELEKK